MTVDPLLHATASPWLSGLGTPIGVTQSPFSVQPSLFGNIPAIPGIGAVPTFGFPLAQVGSPLTHPLFAQLAPQTWLGGQALGIATPYATSPISPIGVSPYGVSPYGVSPYVVGSPFGSPYGVSPMAALVLPQLLAQFGQSPILSTLLGQSPILSTLLGQNPIVSTLLRTNPFLSGIHGGYLV